MQVDAHSTGGVPAVHLRLRVKAQVMEELLDVQFARRGQLPRRIL